MAFGTPPKKDNFLRELMGSSGQAAGSGVMNAYRNGHEDGSRTDLHHDR